MNVLIHIILQIILVGSGYDFQGKVTAVIDGDTIEVLKEGKAIRIRLNGID